MPKLVFAIFIVMYVSSNKLKLRFIWYSVVLLSFAVSSFNSKREIIFILILVLFIENIWNPIKFKLNFKSAILILVAGTTFIFFILTSSIMRGYGNYNPRNTYEAISYVGDYAKSDIFLDAVGENFELNYVYGNAINSADLIFSGKQDYLYGTTFLKAFLFHFLERL
ncbi:hypothetical protein [Pedobacter steynii]